MMNAGNSALELRPRKCSIKEKKMKKKNTPLGYIELEILYKK
jgi:hypothetical protein